MIIHSHDYDSGYFPSMPTIEIQVMKRSGQQPIVLKAIVDSGADATMIPLIHLNQLGVRRGQTNILKGIAGGQYEVNFYLVAIQIGEHRPNYIEVIGTTRREEVIVGRDLLNQYNISLNAPAYTVEVFT